MAAILGSEGLCVLPSGHDALFQTWSCTFSNVVNDITSFGNTGVVRRLGISDAQGSAGGFLQDGSADPGVLTAENAVGATGSAMTLTAQDGNTFAFSAVIDQISVSSAVNGDASVTFNFLMADSDGVTQTWG
tara:strand:- start:892 stop:1287 length:396 start_codon:yes stop_codon:yes gene_type:complete